MRALRLNFALQQYPVRLWTCHRPLEYNIVTVVRQAVLAAYPASLVARLIQAERLSGLLPPFRAEWGKAV